MFNFLVSSVFVCYSHILLPTFFISLHETDFRLKLTKSMEESPKCESNFKYAHLGFIRNCYFCSFHVVSVQLSITFSSYCQITENMKTTL